MKDLDLTVRAFHLLKILKIETIDKALEWASSYNGEEILEEVLVGVYRQRIIYEKRAVSSGVIKRVIKELLSY